MFSFRTNNVFLFAVLEDLEEEILLCLDLFFFAFLIFFAQSSEPLEDSSEDDNSPSYWKGAPISELNRAPDCRDTLPEMRPLQDHHHSLQSKK